MLAGLLPLYLMTIQSLQVDVVRQISYRNGDLSVPLRRIHRDVAQLDSRNLQGGPFASVLGDEPLFFQSKMSCDVDGSPNAYHPDDDNLALDTITSAEGSRKDGLPAGPLTTLPSPEIVAYLNGKPYIQPDGPYRGFFVSKTSLEDETLPEISPERYLDARKIQYIVLPMNMAPEARLGDLAAAYDPATGNVAYAVYGDIGPITESGEASIATIRRIGLACVDGKSSPTEERRDILFVVFPNTAPKLAAAEKWPHLQRTIDRLAADAFQAWGGVETAKAVCAASAGGASGAGASGAGAFGAGAAAARLGLGSGSDAVQ